MKRSLPPVRVQGARRRVAEGLTLSNIIPALRNARQLPSGEWFASCPVPEHGQGKGDRNPSLSLRETPDGNLLVHCFAGCDGEAVLQELRRIAGLDARRPAGQASAQQQQVQVQGEDDDGLTLRRYADAKHLNPDALRQWYVSDAIYNGKPAVRIEYRDVDGSLLAVQFRVRLHKGANGEERFKWRKGDSPRIYGLWRIPAFSGKTLWVCEGSSDLHTLWSAGIPAVAMPTAYSKELAPDLWRVAERFERVFLCLDNDSAGQGLLQEVVKACPPELQERACVVQLPESAKDVGDLWAQCEGDAERFKAQLRECAENAQPLLALLDSLTGATGATGATDDALKVVSFDALPETSAPAIVDGLIYSERITILVGEAGIGKTTLAAEVVNDLLHGGRLWGRIQLQPARVLWVGYDHSPAHLKHLMNAYYGERPRPNLYFIESGWQEPLVPETFARWRALLEELRPDLLVCDTLHDFFATPDELSNLVARDSIQLLRRLIEGLGTGVILLHHPSKMLATTVSTRAVGGAHAWSAKVDVVALMHYASREGFPPDRFVKLSVVKNRESGAWQQVFERIGRRFIPVSGEELPQGEWGVVRSFLETQGQASYEQLLDALQQQGFRITLKALQHRVQRWTERGFVVAKREGFPAKTFIRLAQVQLQTPVSPVAPVAPVSHAVVNTGATEDSEVPTAVAPVSPVAPVSHRRGNCGATEDSEAFTTVSPVAPVAPVSPTQVNSGATVPDADLAHIIEHRSAKGESHLAPLLCELWALARELDYPRVSYKQAHSVIPCASGYISALKHLDAGDLPLLLDALRKQVSAAGATAPAPTPLAPHADGGGSSLSVVPQGLVN